MRRQRNAKIIATLGPASSSPEMIEALFEAGVDVFRLNLSHGTHEEHLRSIQIIRSIETRHQRPIGILLDLQGPKFRVGALDEEKIYLEEGKTYAFDLNPQAGTQDRIPFPHPEVYAALKPGMQLLLDDGRLVLEVVHVTAHCIEAIVEIGGVLLSHKGVNIPEISLPVSSLTEKDLKDLSFGLENGVDWIALSFVQRLEDIIEARTLIQKQAKIITKIEKPQALELLEEIITISDGIMIARGDLGVELSLEEIPCIQKRIINACRKVGKPVVVATQMLDSMVHNPAPTRAEASDVATAVYEGADAVMLSTESALGAYPIESTLMMNKIIQRVEGDPLYHQNKTKTFPAPVIADAIMSAVRQITNVIPISAIVAFTDSGLTALMAARERPKSSILTLTTSLTTARHLSLVWGIYAVIAEPLTNTEQMVRDGTMAAISHNFACYGDTIIITAGVPFGVPGTTNMIRVSRVEPPDAKRF